MNLETVCPIHYQCDPVALHPGVNRKWIGSGLPCFPKNLIENVANRDVIVGVVDIDPYVVRTDEQILCDDSPTLDVEEVVCIRGR